MCRLSLAGQHIDTSIETLNAVSLSVDRGAEGKDHDRRAVLLAHVVRTSAGVARQRVATIWQQWHSTRQDMNHTPYCSTVATVQHREKFATTDLES